MHPRVGLCWCSRRLEDGYNKTPASILDTVDHDFQHYRHSLEVASTLEDPPPWLEPTLSGLRAAMQST
jgi:hypothetical protein